jgi:type IV pilus assembly protein PilX
MQSPLRQSQRGAVLIVALMFLVILTMLGVTAMTGTTMELRVANNTRDSGVAFQAAEAALRDARNDIIGQALPNGVPRNPPMHLSSFGNGGADNTCNSAGGREGLCRPNGYARVVNAVLPPPPSVDMKGLPSVQYGTYTGARLFTGVVRQPRYIIELFGLPAYQESIGSTGAPNWVFYRITARGYGGNPNTEVTLQEVFIYDPS